MNKDIAKIAQKFINLEVIALTFLLPLFFLPITTEFFEFNKLILLAVAVILGALACGIKAAASGKLGLRRTPFDLPVIFLWLATLISTILSEHLLTSIAGHYLRWHPSLVTVTIFAVFYFILTSNLERWALKYIGYALLCSAALGAFLFIPQYFGANLFGKTWSAARSFTLLGSPNILALFLGITVPLALRGTIVRTKRWEKLTGLVLTLLLLFTLTLLNSAVGWVALTAAILISLSGIEFSAIKRSWPYLLATFLTFAFFAIFILVPPIRSHTPFKDGPPREIGLDFQTSWSISATSFRQRPLWGSGPGTFLFDFTRYKPLSYNYTPLWSIRFDKPISEYLLAFAETGLLGIFAYLLLTAVFVRTLLRPVRQAQGRPEPVEGRRGFGGQALLPIGAGILAAFFLSYSTIVSGFLLILSLASLTELDYGRLGEDTGGYGREDYKGFIALGLTVVFALFLGLGVYRLYAAEVAYRQAITALGNQDYPTAYNHQLRTLSYFPWRDSYHAGLAQTSFTWANQIAGKQDLTEEEQNNIQILVTQAIQEAKRATELSPLNVNNWEMLAQTYRNLIGSAKGAENWAANSYLQAINLDLFNPVLRVNFGGLFYRQEDYERAIEQFRAAVNLKNNYANAYYNLGRAYKETGEVDRAIQSIETALRLTPEDTQGYKEAKAILEELKKKKSK